MPVEITMPQLSDTMTEGTLVKWLKKEGEAIKSGEKIAEVETDKAVMEQEVFDDGVVAALVAGEGEKVTVGSLLAVIAKGSENPADVKKQYASRSQASAPAASTPHSRQEVAATRKPVLATPENFAKASAGEIREPDYVGHGATRQPPTAVPPLPLHSGNGGRRQRISPLARRIARQRNMDITSLRGSGPGGRIVKQDVISFKAPQARPSPAPRNVETQVVAMTKMRSAIARQLVASKQNIPHFYETIDADVEDIVRLRAGMNEMLESEKIRLSIGDFVSKAVAIALTRHPGVNATFNGDQITKHAEVNLGMAVSIPDGLIVPVLRNIHTMGLKEIRQRSVDLVDRARAQRLKQDEMMGGTFTVSNLGAFGIREFSAIINPPQVAILAVGAAEKRPVVRGDQIVARTILSMTLSADHRVVDGAAAADFLKTLKSLLEQPGMMLI
jgi:pyruvate dehydrogenase E2 component (dihydrolipoamide acetyltransferase)